LIDIRKQFFYSNGPKIIHKYPTAVFKPKNEIWIFDDNYPEIFTLPADLASPITGSNVGSWKRWPGTTLPQWSTSGGAAMAIVADSVYVFGGNNYLNNRLTVFCFNFCLKLTIRNCDQSIPISIIIEI